MPKFSRFKSGCLYKLEELRIAYKIQEIEVGMLNLSSFKNSFNGLTVNFPSQIVFLVQSIKFIDTFVALVYGTDSKAMVILNFFSDREQHVLKEIG